MKNGKGSDKIITSIYEDDGAPGPANVVTRDVEDMHEQQQLMQHIVHELSTEQGFLDILLDDKIMSEYSPNQYFEWEFYQQRMFEIEGWIIFNKCRQSGGSFALAAKAFARGMLANMKYDCIFTSITKDEATNKIDYVRMFLEALPPRFRKKIIRDPLQLIEWENPNGTRVKILSHAQKPIRGINGDIGLDEVAFYQRPDEIYTSALPAAAAVKGNIYLISTPFGKGGIFYDVFNDKFKYPQYTRLPVYWWMVRRYLKNESDEFYAKAFLEAHKMSSEERVHIFGNKQIQLQLANAFDLESFQQEFEGFFVDEQAAFFSRDTIKGAMFYEDESLDHYNPYETDFHYEDGTKMSAEVALKREDSELEKFWEGQLDAMGRPINFKTYKRFEDLEIAVKNGEVVWQIIAGYDVGTTRHSSCLFIMEEIMLASGGTLQIERFSFDHDNSKSAWLIDDQSDFLAQKLMTGIISKMIVDATGAGMALGQRLARDFPGIVYDLQMGGNNQKQEMLMTNLRARMEHKFIALRYERRSMDDLYNIQRVVGANRSVRFEADEKKRHHSDKAWAIAFASAAGTPFVRKDQNSMGINGVMINAPEVLATDRQAERQNMLQSNHVTNTLGLAKKSGGVFGMNLGNTRSATQRILDSDFTNPGRFNNRWED